MVMRIIIIVMLFPFLGLAQSETIQEKTVLDGTERIQLFETDGSGNRRFIKLNAIGAKPRQITTGTVVMFDEKKVYGSDGAPVNGNVTFNLTGAVVDQQFMIHRGSSQPTFPSTAYVGGVYVPNQNNFIRILYVTPTRFMVWINE